MSELITQLVKAVRLLPAEEQDKVLGDLLEERLQAGGGQAVGVGFGTPLTSAPHLSLLPGAMGESGGGSWQTLPVRLSPEQHERLKQWCQANNFTMAVVLRGLVARFLDEQSRRAGGTGANPAAPAAG